MKHTALMFLFALICGTAFSQYDYCSQIRKADYSAEHNFLFHQNYVYQTVNGFKAYNANYSFSDIYKGYIYRNEEKWEFYFQQQLSNDSTKYYEISKAFEKCLVNDINFWTKIESKNKQGILFNCAKTGSSFMISSGGLRGVILRIERSASKRKSLFNLSLLYDLKDIAADLDNGFKNTIGSFIDSGISGKKYKSKINLNKRNESAIIYVRPAVLDKTKTEYFYTDFFPGTDVTPEAVQIQFERNLHERDGWVKGKPMYGAPGIAFRKGNTIIELKISKASNTKDDDNTHVSIRKFK